MEDEETASAAELLVAGWRTLWEARITEAAAVPGTDDLMTAQLSGTRVAA